MTLDEEINNYLKHFGVKGMHWGVRKIRSNAKSNEPSSGIRRTIEEHPVAAVRVAKVTAIAGTAIAAGIIAHRSGVRLPDIRSSPSISSGSAKSADILRNVGQQRFSAIPMPPIGGFAKPRVRQTTSASGDIKAMRSSIATLIKAANSDLRANDNRLNIPFAQRSYIPEWN